MHFQLKITLQDVAPPIWRRILVPSGFTLFDLHNAIQIAMGWEDYHLHDFTINRQRYAIPDDEDVDDPIDETQTVLNAVLRPRRRITYEYDFGDGWLHVIMPEKVVDDPRVSGVICVAGARACPPEDSGGPWGYQEKLRALAQDGKKATKELREWLGADFDPEFFDSAAVNVELQRFFRRSRRNTRPSAGH